MKTICTAVSVWNSWWIPLQPCRNIAAKARGDSMCHGGSWRSVWVPRPLRRISMCYSPCTIPFIPMLFVNSCFLFSYCGQFTSLSFSEPIVYYKCISNAIYRWQSRYSYVYKRVYVPESSWWYHCIMIKLTWGKMYFFFYFVLQVKYWIMESTESAIQTALPRLDRETLERVVVHDWCDVQAVSQWHLSKRQRTPFLHEKSILSRELLL